MALEVVSPFITLLIFSSAIGGSVPPAFYFVNRFLRDKPYKWNMRAGVGIMLIFGFLFSGLIIVNGVAGSSYVLLSINTVLGFVYVFLGAIVAMIVVGLPLAIPLHYLLRWLDPPEIVREYEI